MWRKCAAVTAAACLVVASIAGTASARPERDPAATPAALSWTECDDPAAREAGIRCSDLSVPADWRRPQGAQTSIGLAKIAAKDPKRRIGTLLVNLGADGTTAQHLPASKEKLAELTRWYDVVAFDARGKGTSSPVTCPAAPNMTTPIVSLDRDSWRRFAKENRAWESRCRRAAGPLADSLDSWHIAHDMEAIRQALGEGGLSYFGNSYGTLYGAAYAELFPQRVRRMFLDSVPDHTSRSPVRATRPMARVMATKFRAFDEWCRTDDACALRPASAREVWDEVMARARREPLPAPDAGEGATVGPDILRLATANLVGDQAWPKLANALARARAGDASDFYLDVSSQPAETSVARLAWCSDLPFEHGWDTMNAIDRRLRTTGPRVGWLLARTNYSRCAGLRHQGTNPPHRIAPDGLPPVLLVGGLDDHTTPPAGGRRLARQLPGAAWIGARSDHAVYLNGERCVRRAAHRYLLTGALPESGQVCS